LVEWGLTLFAPKPSLKRRKRIDPHADRVPTPVAKLETARPRAP
jgi:hypothetical protein